MSTWNCDGNVTGGGSYAAFDDAIGDPCSLLLPSNEQFLDDAAAATTENDELYFHPHWLRYADVIDGAPEWFISGIGVYITVVCIAGFLGNVAVVSVFFR
jgi:hypothetical protein